MASSFNQGFWSDCAESRGETTCGSRCCATGQYCNNESQCEDFTSTGCDASLGQSSDQCGSQTAQTAATSFVTPITFPSGAATSWMAMPSSSPAATALLTVDTSSLTVLVTSFVVLTSDRSATVTSSVAISTTSESTATETPSKSPSSTLFSVVSSADTTLSDLPTSVSMPTTSPTASISPKHISKTTLIAVSVVGSAVAVFIASIFLCLYLRRRKKRPRPRTAIRDGFPSEENLDVSRHASYRQMEIPEPNPYFQRFPQEPSPVSSPDRSGIRGNNSRLNPRLRPDHDTGNRRPPPNLRFSPAHDPYGHNDDGEGRFSPPPPSYRSRLW